MVLSEREFCVIAQFLVVQVGSWRLIDIDSYYGLLKLKFCRLENQQEYLSWVLDYIAAAPCVCMK